MSAYHEIAREARALKRDNAADAVERAIRRTVDLDHEAACVIVGPILGELAAWLTERGEAGAAGLLGEFAP